jgi:RNA polymerase sigma factor (sigma-70 family)
MDAHPPIREWVRAILAPYQIEVTPAGTGAEALAQVAQGAHFDAAICEVLMPYADTETAGVALTRTLWYEHHIPCLILTSVQEPGSRLAALYAGVIGYVPKHVAESDLLVRSVLALLQGQRPQDPLAAIAISVREACQIAEARAAYLRAIQQLTPQQRVVAKLILEGKTNHEIAEQLVLSRGTVNSHVSNILQRLNLASRRSVKSRVVLSDAGNDLPAGRAIPDLHRNEGQR